MPGRTPAQARQAFLKPLRRVLSCVTDAQLYTVGDDVEVLSLSQNPLLLHSPLGALQVKLRY